MRSPSAVRRVFRPFPEVTNVVSQTGRPDDGTDTTGFFNLEFNVDLKPEDQWPEGLTKPNSSRRSTKR